MGIKQSLLEWVNPLSWATQTREQGVVEREHFFQALFISLVLILALPNFLHFKKGSIILSVLTKPAFLQVKYL